MVDTGGALYTDEGVHHEWVEELIDTPIGKVRRIKTGLSSNDRLDNCKVRWGINRYSYAVSPGLYAVGKPDENAPVLVTANYKLTFDLLRKELAGLDLWILVLDTKGINVWCAAGKGTFGTFELINRIKSTKLEQVVSHRKIILPQLGAPGVASQEVAQSTGFKVVFGPVRAEDIPSFLANGLKATQEMRTVRFEFKDRLVLTPMEIIPGLKLLLIPIILFMVTFLIRNGINGTIWQALIKVTFLNFIPYVVAYLLGTFFVPVLLPYIPFRSFALKGFYLGAIWAIMFAGVYDTVFEFPTSSLLLISNILMLLSLTSFTALNFTGSSTYTSLSGTQKETLIGVPLMALGAVVGIGMFITYTIVNYGRY